MAERPRSRSREKPPVAAAPPVAAVLPVAAAAGHAPPSLALPMTGADIFSMTGMAPMIDPAQAQHQAMLQQQAIIAAQQQAALQQQMALQQLMGAGAFPGYGYPAVAAGPSLQTTQAQIIQAVAMQQQAQASIGLTTGGVGSIGNVPPTLGEDKLGCEYVLGYVSHIFPEKNYSLLNTRNQKSVLVNKNIIDPSQLTLNEACAFRIQTNEEGQLNCRPPFYKLKGNIKPGVPITFGEWHGIVKQAQKNGDFFVDCPEVKEKYGGRDPYVHTSVGNACDIKEGDSICFTLHVNKAGFPQVEMPVWRRVKQGVGQISGELDQAIHFGLCCDIDSQKVTFHSNQFGSVFAVPPVIDPEAVSVGDMVAFGLKKKNSPNNIMAEGPIMKFCGRKQKARWDTIGEFIGKIPLDSAAEILEGKGTFVSCLSASDRHGREVHCHTSVLTECDLKAGDNLCFNVHTNAKGWPQLTSPVWKVISPESNGYGLCKWVRCDTIKPGSAVEMPDRPVYEAPKRTPFPGQVPLVPLVKVVSPFPQMGGPAPIPQPKAAVATLGGNLGLGAGTAGLAMGGSEASAKPLAEKWAAAMGAAMAEKMNAEKAKTGKSSGKGKDDAWQGGSEVVEWQPGSDAAPQSGGDAQWQDSGKGKAGGDAQWQDSGKGKWGGDAQWQDSGKGKWGGDAQWQGGGDAQWQGGGDAQWGDSKGKDKGKGKGSDGGKDGKNLMAAADGAHSSEENYAIGYMMSMILMKGKEKGKW